MTDTLLRDTELQFPQLIVVSASAGSGKTTALTKRYVQFLLSTRIRHHRPRHMLAITFTNNAATEMKQRILDLLRSLAFGDEALTAEMAVLTGTQQVRVPAVAERVLEDLLDNFSDFHVRTIDSFLTNVLRSSAIDLGYSPNVEVRLDAKPVLAEVFREFSRTAARDPAHLGILRQLAALAEEGRTSRDRFLWDPYTSIASRVADLYSALATTALPVLVPALKQEELVRREAARTVGKELSNLIRTSGLEMNAHLRKDLDDIASGDIDAVLERTVKGKAFNNPRTQNQRTSVGTYGGKIEEILRSLNDILADISFLQARQYYNAYALTLSLLSEKLTEKKAAENIVLLDDINRVLRSYLTQNTVPELYIKLGETVYHYLVDEFQDTSPAQWEALRPLFEDTLSSEGSLFVVGDMKQSIFGFRGADWRVMKALMETTVFPSAPPRVLSLTTNYRSRKELVEAVRTVFHDGVGTSEFRGAADATGLSAYDLLPNPAEGRRGFVEVKHLPADMVEQREPKEVVDFVRSCRDRGHRWEDIAVLTPANSDVVRFSSALNAAGIPSVSQSSLDIRNRKVIAELISCLRFLDAPVDDAAFGIFLFGDVLRAQRPDLTTEEVRKLLRANTEDAHRPALYVRFREQFPEVWSSLFEDLFRHVGYLPLYDLVSALIGTFRVFEHFPDEEAALVQLLECVREFESGGMNSIRDFVHESRSEGGTISWELPRPSGDDAVTLMTIHKAKGLGFPVVAVVLYDWSRKGGRPVFNEVDGQAELVRVTQKNTGRHPVLRRLYDDMVMRWQADELNKLYVALTRAKEEMLVLVVTRDATKAPAVFLTPSRTEGPDEVVRAVRGGVATAPIVLLQRTTFPVERQQPMLKDRELRRGELIHLVLSRLHRLDDPATDLSVALDSVPTGDADLDLDEVRQTLLRFLSTPSARSLFDRPGTVLIEHDIADKTGRVRRVDRAVVGDEEILVIDFKTGGDELEQEYRNQVRQYMDLLGAVYPARRVEGVLAYVDRRTVVTVSA